MRLVSLFIVCLLVASLLFISSAYASEKFDVTVKIVDTEEKEENVSIEKENEVLRKKGVTGFVLLENNETNLIFFVIIILIILLSIFFIKRKYGKIKEGRDK